MLLRKVQNYIIATTVQSHCYQILKKFLKNLCIRDYTPLSITIISVTYSWDLDKNIALINVTENVRKALDDGNIGCGIFVDL